TVSDATAALDGACDVVAAVVVVAGASVIVVSATIGPGRFPPGRNNSRTMATITMATNPTTYAGLSPLRSLVGGGIASPAGNGVSNVCGAMGAGASDGRGVRTVIGAVSRWSVSACVAGRCSVSTFDEMTRMVSSPSTGMAM